MKRARGRTSALVGFALGAATSVLAVSIFYVASRFAHLPFAPFDVFEWMTRWLPGSLITAGIDLMVAVIRIIGTDSTSAAAKAAEKTLAVITFVVGAGVLGAIAARASRRVGPLLSALAAGALGLLVIAGAELSLGRATRAGLGEAALVLLGWSAVLAVSLRGTEVPAVDTPEAQVERRRFLGRVVAAVAAVSSVLLGIEAALRRGYATPPAGGTAGAGSAPAPVIDEPVGTTRLTSGATAEIDGGRLPPARGTRPELTANDRFYRIDINLQPPRVEASQWRLQVDGLVSSALSLTLADIRALPRVSQNITLECISNPLGGDLISTSRWTGVRLADVLRLAGPSDRARTIHMEAADGFYESLTLAEAQDPRVLLVYDMNGVPLPVEHGFPLRIYIPDRHGMKQPKWITRLRLSDEEGRGYWVDRGWSKEAIVKTTSVVDTVGASMMLGIDKVLGIGGIAFAGARGISKVEVQVDDGPWTQAQLIEPPIGSLCWVLWRYDWPYTAGRHTFRVRAYDGTGALQPTKEQGPHPDGASGIHAITMSV